MVVLIIISLIVLFITGLFIIPIQIVINTQKNEYYISLPGYFRVDLLFTRDYNYSIKLKILFFSFRIFPGKRRNSVRDVEEPRKNIQKTKRRKKQKITFSFIKKIIKCFKIKKLNADIDTGDYPLNAQLIPIAHAISQGNTNIDINFQNRNVLDICVNTRIYKITYTTIKYKMFN